jgi:outer membrane protein assembly factor BamB
VAALLVATLAGSVLGWRLMRNATHSVTPAPALPSVEALKPAAPEPALFAPGSLWPLFARNEQGAAVDPILWGRSEGQSCLARFDARSGKRSWMICPYGPPAGGPWADNQNRSALAGDRILVEWKRNLDAFDAKTGEKRWTVRLDERARDYCLGSDGAVRVVLDGGDVTYSIALETGKLTPAARPQDCQSLWTDWEGNRHWSAPGQDFSGRAGGPTVDGMVTERRVARGGHTILLGHARPGPHVPAAAAVDRQGKTLWKRELPPMDPSAVDTEGPSHATLDDHRLCATYAVKPGRGALRLGCWDPATGATLWDSGIPDDGIEAILFTEMHLILVHHASEWGEGKAYVFYDLARGTRIREL